MNKPFCEKALAGLKAILTANPMDILTLWANQEGEPAQVARKAVYTINFICANLGIIIVLFSIYLFYGVYTPTCDAYVKVVDNTGRVFTISDFKSIDPSCLNLCNRSLSNFSVIKSIR